MKLKEQKFITIDNPRKLRTEDLHLLYKNLIEPDPAFNINVQGGGFNGNIAELIYDFINDKLEIDKKAHILIINDMSLQLYNILNSSGCTNITLAYGDYKRDYKKERENIISEDDTTYNLMYNYIKSTFTGHFRIVKLREIMNTDMKFDLIISNPPYDIGNAITRNIVAGVAFKHFINLMPASKYKNGDLYKHIVPTRIIHSNSTTEFSRVSTAPICAEISKNSLCDISWEAFEVKYLFDQRLEKFWGEQLRREQTYLSHIYGIKKVDANKFSSKTCYSCGIYTPNIMLWNGPKAIKNSDGTFKTNDRHYIWNFLKPEGSLDQYFENDGNNIGQTVTVFNTEQEADNFKNWVHSGELSGKGRLSGLFSILLRAMNKPTGCPFPYAIPNVDWSHPWTDEEILKDYGYSDEEIEEILHFNDDIKTRGGKN